MDNRRKYDWPELISQFNASGLNQSRFCKEHNLNPKYFNKQLNNSRKMSRSSFVPIEVDFETGKPDFTGISFVVGNCTVHCPKSMSLEDIVTLAKRLA